MQRPHKFQPSILPARKSPDELKKLWAEYLTTKNDRLRNLIAENYLHIVRYHAERVHVRLPDEVQIEDLISCGFFGLVDAVKNYNPDRGVKFETYCAPRIRGSILDELRQMDWVPRLVRSRSSKVGKLTERYISETGSAPTEKQIMKELDIDQNEYEKVKKDSHPVGTVSLSRKWFETDSNKDVREIDILVDSTLATPAEIVTDEDTFEVLVKKIGRLGIVLKTIFLLYHVDHMSMNEIGQTLDISESRVSQMHSSMILQLRAMTDID
jgi:RNA polymerase sigma factor for flagellar operon FliA